jgi:hypothetical protein
MAYYWNENLVSVPGKIYSKSPYMLQKFFSRYQEQVKTSIGLPNESRELKVRLLHRDCIQMPAESNEFPVNRQGDLEIVEPLVAPEEFNFSNDAAIHEISISNLVQEEIQPHLLMPNIMVNGLTGASTTLAELLAPTEQATRRKRVLEIDERKKKVCKKCYRESCFGHNCKLCVICKRCHESEETECLPIVNPMRIQATLDWNKRKKEREEEAKERRRQKNKEKKNKTS